MTIESPIQPDRRELNPKYRVILDGPPAENYNMRQVQLAMEKFGADLSTESLDDKTLNEIIMKWSDSPYSRLFRDFVHSEGFKEHPRFQGNIANINLEDIEFFAREMRLPE